MTSQSELNMASLQSDRMGVRVCKSVCIEEKISGREVADYVASKE